MDLNANGGMGGVSGGGGGYGYGVNGCPPNQSFMGLTGQRETQGQRSEREMEERLRQMQRGRRGGWLVEE